MRPDTSRVCKLSNVNMADSSSTESSSTSGSDYSEFEAFMEGEDNERIYEPISEIRSWRFEPPGRIAVISPTSDFANVTFANVFGRLANAMSRLANVLLVTSPTQNI